MSLTSKQRRALRGLGQKRGDDVHLGKAGLTEGFVENLSALLDRHELIKLRFDDLEGDMRKQLVEEVCKTVDAECAGLVGRTMLLYRENPDNEQHVLDRVK